MRGGALMKRLLMLNAYVLPALAIAAFVGHVKFGVSPYGFSSGN
jgi:hypothetical protein